jgi:hypothetical protein
MLSMVKQGKNTFFSILGQFSCLDEKIQMCLKLIFKYQKTFPRVLLCIKNLKTKANTFKKVMYFLIKMDHIIVECSLIVKR